MNDFIYVSETCLSSFIAADDKDLSTDGYNIVCADHPSSLKEGVYAFIAKNHLPFS